MNYIFIYGTLKRGEHNSSLLSDYDYIGPGRADCFVMLDLGGCPGLVPGKAGNSIHMALGEIYAVPDDKLSSLLEMLDQVENNERMYIRVKIPITYIGKRMRTIECITYLFMPHLKLSQLVTSGNWSRKT